MSDATLPQVLAAFLLNPADIEPLENAGGFSGARIWRVAGESSACLRCWPVGTTPQRVSDVHRGLRAVAQAGGGRLRQTLAIPHLSTHGESMVRAGGRIFELAPWLPGNADFHARPTLVRLRAALMWLAEFHTAADQLIASHHRNLQSCPGIHRRLERCRQLMNGRLDIIESSLPGPSDEFSTSVGLPLIARFRETVSDVLPALESIAAHPVSLHLCLRDIWHDHVLFCEDELTGVVDYDAMRIDSPACDVARLLRSLAGENKALWKEGIDAYSSIRELRQPELRLVGVFDAANCLMSGLQWLEWLYVDRRTFTDLPAVHQRARQWLASRPRQE